MRKLTKKQRAEIYKEMIGQDTWWLSNRTPLKGLKDKTRFFINPKLLTELGAFVDLRKKDYGFGATYISNAEGFTRLEVDRYFDIILFFCIEMTK